MGNGADMVSAQLSLLPDVEEAPALVRLVPHPLPLASVLAPTGPLSEQDLVDRARAYVEQARSPETRRAYDGDWRRFAAWCRSLGRAPFPAEPDSVALYLTELAARGRKLATLRRARAAISVAHRGVPERPTHHPAVADVIRGVARTQGEPPTRAAAISAEQLSAMMAACGVGTVRAARDRAMLALGFAGAFRRSALVSLEVEDLRFVERGLEVRLRRDKVDPRREGRIVPVAPSPAHERCPVRAARRWLEASGLTSGPLFRAIRKGPRLDASALHPRAVDRLVKRTGKAAGVVGVSSHSLRAGFITAAIRKRHPVERIRVVSGHKEGSKAFEAYIRFAGIWDGYAGEGVI
ncbi:MAG: tyrosine-type recombinase/integrase [Sandaracinaceae bacterium]